MASFEELSATLERNWKRTASGNLMFAGHMVGEETTLDAVKNFFNKNNFTNIEYLDAGSSAIILKDLDNPNLVFRIAPIAEHDERAVIPQVLQPIHVENLRKIKIEVMKNVSIPDEMPNDKFGSLLDHFMEEVDNSNHSLSTRYPQKDVGLFRYEDSKKLGTYKEVFIATDASLIRPVKDATPTCSSDYPTLEDQWREQCKMVQADPRLEKLLGGLPAKLPPTKQRGDFGRG